MPLDLTDDESRQQAITWANVDPDLCRQMASLGLNELTNPDRDKMAQILQKTFSNEFSWIKNC